jgi:hypothetical protein
VRAFADRRPSARALGALAACAVAALAPAVAHGQAEGAPAAPQALLPDLQQQVPNELGLAVVRKPGAGLRVKLGFRSTTSNMGLGPLQIDGVRASRRVRRMRADQLVRMSDGTTRTVKGIGGLHYVAWKGHQHWHFDDFMRYQLRSFDGKRLVATDEKRGFCLGDRRNMDIFTEMPNEPRSPVFRTNCGWHLPQLLHVHEGISVGNADYYTPQLEGQDIDITKIPDGRYWLVHTANPARRMLESDYSNDSSSVLLRFAWKRLSARHRRIVVTPLIACPGATRCSAPTSNRPLPANASSASSRGRVRRAARLGGSLSVTLGVTRVSAPSFLCHLR